MNHPRARDARWARLALLAVSAAACVRVVVPAAAGAHAVGADCAADGDCATAHCQQGVCCDRTCEPHQACNLARARGQCVPRVAGDPCIPSVDGTCGAQPCFSESLARPDGGTEEVAQCCATACAAPLHSCVLPRAPGACVDRGPGDPCLTDDQCPPGDDGAGHCTDGVCCNSRCDGLCVSCANPSSPGRCTAVPDNEDPALECGAETGGCLACFGGSCLPALAGTDPKDACPGPLVCSTAAQCGQPEGAACTTQPDGTDDCAVGRCLFGRCLSVHAEELSGFVLSWNFTELQPTDVVMTADGEPTVTWNERRDDSAGNIVETHVVVARRSNGDWHQREITRYLYSTSVAITALGNWVLVLTAPTAERPDCDLSPNICTVRGRWLDPNGNWGGEEVVWAPPLHDTGGGYLAPDRPVCDLRADAFEDGRILLAVTLGEPGYSCYSTVAAWNAFLFERRTDGRWHPVSQAPDAPGATPDIPDTLQVRAITAVDGLPAVVDRNGTTGAFRVTLVRPDGQEIIPYTHPACPGPLRGATMVRTPRPLQPKQLLFAGQCDTNNAAAAVILDVRQRPFTWTAVVNTVNTDFYQSAVPLDATEEPFRVALMGSSLLNYSIIRDGAFSSAFYWLTEVENPPGLSGGFTAGIGPARQAVFLGQSPAGINEVVSLSVILIGQ